MLIAVLLMCSMDALAKWLLARNVTAVQILAFRSIIIIPLLLLVYKARGNFNELIPSRWKPQLLRGAVGFISPFTFFIGIKYIPLTDAVVLFFSSIFIVTILSVVFLKERVGVHRFASILVGFIGVLIVATPQGGGSIVGYILVLIGSATYSILFVTGRYLSRTESVASLVFSYNLCVGVISLLILPWFWLPVASDNIVWLLLLSALAVSGHYFVTLAFARSEATLVAPFEYTALIWAVGFDFLLWNTVPSLSTSLGAIVIISSGLYIVHRERAHLSLPSTS